MRTFSSKDHILVNRKLSINAGLRYQYDTSPYETSGVMANFNPQTGALDPVGTSLVNVPAKNFGPRFGIAYSPFGPAGTVIRTGFGMFYGTLNAALAQNVPNNVLQQGGSITRQAKTGLGRLPLSSYFVCSRRKLHRITERLEDGIHRAVEFQYPTALKGKTRWYRLGTSAIAVFT